MRKVEIIGVGVLMLLVLLVAWSALAPAAAQENKALQPTPRWEYKVVSLTGVAIAPMEDALNRLGADGWEVCTTPQRDRTAGGMDVVILKRPRR